MLGLALTTALPTGVAIWGLCLLALFVGLYAHPSPSRDALPLGVRERAT